MNDLIVCPRITSGNFSLSITGLREFSVWILMKSGDLLSGVIGNDAPITQCALASVPAHASVVVKTTDALTITISRDLPFYVIAGRKHAVEVGFSHSQSFKAEEFQGNRTIVHFALPYVESSEYALNLVMRPGQSVKVVGTGFEQTVNVR